MATLKPRADENAPIERQKPAGKAQAAQGRGANRKALGDIGNLVGPFNSRCNVGKENAGAKNEPAAKQAKPAGVLTRRSAAAAGIKIDDSVLAQWKPQKSRQSLKGSTKENDAPAQAQTKEPAVGSRNSLTGLLVSRSENVASTTAVAKAPASPLPDIDSWDETDPLHVTDYAGDIFAYYRRVEPVFRTSADYMNHQVDINDKMRAILLDWLVEVHLKFKLMPETLFLTTSIIDRFLEKERVTRKNLQLVGVTAMLIASKYEEIWAPEVRDFVYISDRAYTKEQILLMEKLILNKLKFDLTVPTVNTFLGRYLKAGCVEDNWTTYHAAYLVELAIPDYGMLKFAYSEIAAAAVMISMKLCGHEPAYPKALVRHSGYKASQLRPCAAALEKLQAKSSTQSLVAVYKKYSSAKFGEVATKFGELDYED